jgi:hypothetical protein
VGNQEFHHSSAILAYASDYLRGKMIKNGRHNRYYIDFSFHSADEWKVVLEFLQPRSMGTAALSWQVLPVVLPWFAEFQLQVLLQDIDHFLLETVVVTQTEDDKDVPMTIHNLLLLAHIGYACGLETTKSQARQWLRSKLLQPQHVPKEIDSNGSEDHDSVNLDWELSDLQLLSSVLKEFEDLRVYLWESSLIVYLPHDLNVEDSHGLVSNSLFPYLLREGMMQLCIVQHAQTLVDQLRTSGAVSPSPTTSSSTTIPTSFALERQEKLTQDMLYVLLKSTYEQLEKFHRETEIGLASLSNQQSIPNKASRKSKTKRKERRRQQSQRSSNVTDMKSRRPQDRQSKETDPSEQTAVTERDASTAVVVMDGSGRRTFEC